MATIQRASLSEMLLSAVSGGGQDAAAPWSRRLFGEGWMGGSERTSIDERHVEVEAGDGASDALAVGGVEFAVGQPGSRCSVRAAWAAAGG